MCGRYQLNISDSKKSKQIKERAQKLNLVYKQGEIFPNDTVLCMIPNESKIDLSVMKWGIKNKSFQINARKESLDDHISYNEMRNRRCAVVCSGFYEWDKDKSKYYINTDDELFYLACIFNENNELLIVTQAADERFMGIHDRMPLILNQEEMIAYIHNKDINTAKKRLYITKDENDIRLF